MLMLGEVTDLHVTHNFDRPFSSGRTEELQEFRVRVGADRRSLQSKPPPGLHMDKAGLKSSLQIIGSGARRA